MVGFYPVRLLFVTPSFRIMTLDRRIICIFSPIIQRIMDLSIFFTLGWMSVGGVALLPQGGLNVHHGLSLMFTSTYFYICPGFTDKTISVLHVFG
jgi:hypothetical protein